jgi:sugar lactone lactonase YvrE
VTQYDNLSARPLGSVSRAYLDTETNTLYAGLRYPGVVAHIAALSLDDGTIRRLDDIKGPQLYRVTSLAYDPDGKTLFYTADNNAYRDLMAVDIETGKSRRLIEDGRIGELVFNRADRSLWGVRHLNGIVTLVRLPPPYEEWNQIHSFDYGQVLYDLDVSPDGRLLSASMGEINGDQHLRVMDIERLMTGDTRPLSTFDFGLAVPESFVFSPDGRYLYGSSYYTGVSNLFRYEVATGGIEAVSNAETGFFRPVPVADDELIFFRYTGQGFVPARMTAAPLEDVSATTFLGQQLVEKHPVLKDWQVGSPADVPIDELITRDGPYRSRQELALESIYPVIEGYQEVVAVGVHANISDPIGFDKIGLTASVSPTSDRSEMLHAQARWQHRAWTTDLRYNYANFYDLFGPTKVSLKGYSGEVKYERPLIYDLPREMDLTVRAGYWGNLEEVPYAQDIDATTDENLVAGSARLDYSFVRRSLGAVDDEKGFRWSAVAGGNYADDTVTPYLFGNFDFGFALPLKHSSLWLRTAAGGADGDRDDPFANFFFGGFRNNWVDHQEVKRYRETFSFPGFGINDIAGQTFVRSILEWNLPPRRFRRAGARDFFVSWARPAVFASALVTDPDDDSEDYYNLGAQVDFQMSVFARLDMMLSLGYAWGARDGELDRTEFMASLKIL